MGKSRTTRAVSILAHIIPRLAEPAHIVSRHLSPICPILFSPARLADHADLAKPRPFEERVHPAHRRERFDPRHRAQLARPPDERRADPRPAISRVQDDALQQPELIVQGGHGERIARILESEESRTKRQARGGGTEDADTDGLIAVPEERHTADEGDPMRTVMPPSEVRPIGDGAGREPEVVVEADPFFFTVRRSTSI